MKIATLLGCTLLMVSCATAQDTRPVPGSPQTCPVMEGKRINPNLYVDYQGVRIYVCCNACVKAVRKDPDKYLAKWKGVGMPERCGTPPKAATGYGPDNTVIKEAEGD